MSRPGVPPAAVAAAWQCSSLLLDYPGEELADRLGLVDEVARRLPARVRDPLCETIGRLSALPLRSAQEEYVATFDARRRCSLFLTYFLYGDTRKRGAALLRFTQAYLRAGYRLDRTELPDHLAVVLEYGAAVDPEHARTLLTEHRAGIEVLRIALRDLASPWAGAVAAVSATLPPLRGDEREVVRRLAAEGPPDEEVGLSPYDGSAFDPLLTERTATVDLPHPTVPGAR